MTPLHPLLSSRFSARHYTGAPISPEALASLLEAARWAPSSRNEQPWAFVVAPRQDEAAFNKILACLAPTNQSWAKDAAVLMVCCTARKFTDRDLVNRHAWHDVGLAVMSMAVQAVHLGLQAREMGGIDAEAARQACQIPESHEITSALAIGVAGEVSEYLAARARKPVAGFAWHGTWGQAERQ